MTVTAFAKEHGREFSKFDRGFVKEQSAMVRSWGLKDAFLKAHAAGYRQCIVDAVKCQDRTCDCFSNGVTFNPYHHPSSSDALSGRDFKNTRTFFRKETTEAHDYRVPYYNYNVCSVWGRDLNRGGYAVFVAMLKRLIAEHGFFYCPARHEGVVGYFKSEKHDNIIIAITTFPREGNPELSTRIYKSKEHRDMAITRGEVSCGYSAMLETVLGSIDDNVSNE